MSCYSSSIIGRRDSNEDKHKIIENLDGSINDKNKINFYSLFDGHGGKDVMLMEALRCPGCIAISGPTTPESIHGWWR